MMPRTFRCQQEQEKRVFDPAEARRSMEDLNQNRIGVYTDRRRVPMFCRFLGSLG
jgi:hypothetical protein